MLKVCLTLCELTTGGIRYVLNETILYDPRVEEKDIYLRFVKMELGG